MRGSSSAWKLRDMLLLLKLDSLDMTTFLGSTISLSSVLLMLMKTGLRSPGEPGREDLDLSRLSGDMAFILWLNNLLLRADLGVLVLASSDLLVSASSWDSVVILSNFSVTFLENLAVKILNLPVTVFKNMTVKS